MLPGVSQLNAAIGTVIQKYSQHAAHPDGNGHHRYRQLDGIDAAFQAATSQAITASMRWCPDVFNCIEMFYNPLRWHSALDYRSPREFERR
jgi:hypothetical protein